MKLKIGKIFNLNIILENNDYNKKDFNKMIKLAKEHLAKMNYIYFYGYPTGHAPGYIDKRILNIKEGLNETY